MLVLWALGVCQSRLEGQKLDPATLQLSDQDFIATKAVSFADPDEALEEVAETETDVVPDE